MINEINDVLQGYETKVILYTYDSLLFDFNVKDSKGLLLLLKNKMSDNGRYPVKIKAGKDLHTMIDMTGKVQ